MGGGGDIWEQPLKGVLSPKWGWDSYGAWSTFTCNAGFLRPFPLWQSLVPGSAGALQPHLDGHTLHIQHPPTRGDLHTAPPLEEGHQQGLYFRRGW